MLCQSVRFVSRDMSVCHSRATGEDRGGREEGGGRSRGGRPDEGKVTWGSSEGHDDAAVEHRDLRDVLELGGGLEDLEPRLHLPEDAAVAGARTRVLGGDGEARPAAEAAWPRVALRLAPAPHQPHRRPLLALAPQLLLLHGHVVQPAAHHVLPRPPLVAHLQELRVHVAPPALARAQGQELLPAAVVGREANVHTPTRRAAPAHLQEHHAVEGVHQLHGLAVLQNPSIRWSGLVLEHVEVQLLVAQGHPCGARGGGAGEGGGGGGGVVEGVHPPGLQLAHHA